MGVGRVESILTIVVSLTTIIPFLLRLFVKPMIDSALAKQTAHFEKLFNTHLRIDHGYRGGAFRWGRGGVLPFKPEDEKDE